MKWLIILFFIVLFGCNTNSIDNHTSQNLSQYSKSRGEKYKDTIITAIEIPPEASVPGYIEKEYFLIVNSDTSCFSLFITLNKEKRSISIKYNYNKFKKSKSAFLYEDTIAEVKEIERYNEYKTTYKDQLRELQLLLDFVSKEYDLSKLSKLTFLLSSIDGLANAITQEYVNKCKNKTVAYSYSKISDLIIQSNFINDVNKILSSYSVKTNKIFV
jgi:hypothetical protein